MMLVQSVLGAGYPIFRDVHKHRSICCILCNVVSHNYRNRRGRREQLFIVHRPHTHCTLYFGKYYCITGKIEEQAPENVRYRFFFDKHLLVHQT